MKRLLVALATILLAGNVYAAQQDITAVSVPETLGGYRGAVNARLVDIDENFDEVYGWGDHGAGGYLTEYVETDPLFTAWDKDYADLTNTPTIPTISNDAYNATTWNDNTDAPSKNAVRDKIESLELSGGGGDDLGDATAGDVAALFSGEGEYLKTDGSTGTPSGSGLTDGTAVGDIPVWDGTSYEPETPAEITFAGSVSYDEGTNTVTGVDTTYTAGTGLTLTGTEFASTATDDQNAAEVTVDATGFTGNLESTDTDVQTALATLDALTIGSGDAADIGVTDTGGYYDGTDVEAILAELGEQIESLLAAFEAAGLNDFTFTPDAPASYPYYSDSGTFNLDFEITDTSTTYAVDAVEWKVGAGSYSATGVTNPSGDIWRVAQSGVSEGSYTYQLEACDDKETPNCEESSTWAVTVDTTDPVVDLTP
jgi:hypothetical protein